MKVSALIFGRQLVYFSSLTPSPGFQISKEITHIGGLFSKRGEKIGVCTPEQCVLFSALAFFCVLFLESILTKS